MPASRDSRPLQAAAHHTLAGSNRNHGRGFGSSGRDSVSGIPGSQRHGGHRRRVDPSGRTGRATLLSLRGLPITSNGLRSLAGLTRLRYLCLNETQVADDGLQHLQRMPELNELWLAKTPFADTGLRTCGACPNCSTPRSRPWMPRRSRANRDPELARLELSVRSGGQASGKSGEDSVLRIVDHPKLHQLQVTLDAGIDEIRIENCPRVWSVQLTVSAPLKRSKSSVARG